MATEKQRFIAAERQQESSGNYQAVNATSGALGAYQVLPGNLSTWLPESGQKDMSDTAYLDCNACQDRLAWVVLGGYYDRYGPAGAAAMWYSGQPDPNLTYGNPPVYQYVADVLALMGDPNLNLGAGPPGNLPPIRYPRLNLAVESRTIAQTARALVWRRMWWVNWYRQYRVVKPAPRFPRRGC